MQEPTGGLRLALKEWAVTVRALEDGHQTILLRKGGIAEKEREFRPRTDDFLLYPTFEHEDPASVQPRHRELLREAHGNPPPEDRVLFRSWGRVEEVLRVEALDPLLDLRDEYIWSPEEIRGRWAWKPERPLYLLGVRILRLPTVQSLPRKRQYGGCRSWVELHEDVAVARSRPVLADDAFADRMDRIARHVGG